VDFVPPPTAPSSSSSSSAATAAAAAAAAAPVLHPDASTLSIPPPHRDDPVWLSLFDRVITAVLACVPLQAGGAGPASGPAAPAPAPSQDALVMTQTALSVLRKLYRNCAPYVASKSGTALSVVLGSLLGAPRDLAAVLERTAEEICDRLPLEMALPHLVTVLAEEVDGAAASSAAGGAGKPGPGGGGAGDAPPSSSAVAGNPSVSIAALRALARLVPRLPSALLLAELGKGRVMEAIRRAFLSTSADVRRAVVTVLVEMHGRLKAAGTGAAFARYAEAYLSPPQQKLLQIYIEKAGDAAARKG
jgi:hypothetical protein